MRHHTIITGTGRAGTTFLVQLLTGLGFDTGYHVDAAVDPIANAGLEWDIRKKHAPYIVKSPWLCDLLPEVIARGDIHIDRAIVPMRDLHDVVESRRAVSRRRGEPGPGGLWKTQDPDAQEPIVTGLFYKLMHTLAEHSIPTTLLAFPRMVEDPYYLYGHLPLLGATPIADFLRVFKETARPEGVHRF